MPKPVFFRKLEELVACLEEASRRLRELAEGAGDTRVEERGYLPPPEGFVTEWQMPAQDGNRLAAQETGTRRPSGPNEPADRIEARCV
jgi:hypothetical protein